MSYKLRDGVSCKACHGPIRADVVPPYCSKRCQLEDQELEYLSGLAKVREDLKWVDKKNHIWPTFDLIIGVGDLHFPFVHPHKLEKFYDHLSQKKMTKDSFVIQVGDLYDFYSQSKFARTHCLYTPEQELKLGKQMADAFWQKVNKIQPKAKKIQLLGNHDLRPEKRLLERCPELQVFFNTKPVFEFENVETIFEADQEVLIGDWVWQHGYTQAGKHMAANQMNTGVGHLHRGYTLHLNLRGTIITELNCGYLGDPESTALKYRERRWQFWTWGYGEVDKLGARFIHL